MLVLSRKVGESIVIGDDIKVTLVRMSGNRVSVGIEAPAHVRVMRSELIEHDRSIESGPESDYSDRLHLVAR